MAPGAQNVSEFVSGRVSSASSSYGGAMTLEERRQKMREGVTRIRGSASPRPDRDLHRFNSFSSIDRPATTFEDGRGMYYKRGDRWDTDSEALDDSTIDGLDFAQSRNQHLPSLHDFARSPAPEESTETSEATDDEDKYSVTTSVKTEPVNQHQHHNNATGLSLQSLNSALQGQGQNNWTNTTRTRVVNRGPSGSVSGSDYHQKYFQQHNFRSGFTVGTATSVPFHSRNQQNAGMALRTRDTSAPPLRTRAMSPGLIGERIMNGHSRVNGFSTSHIANNGGDTIDENLEYSDGGPEVGQARQVRITHQKSFSNMSQTSGMSRTSSTTSEVMRGLPRSPSVRFRTKRSHVMSSRRRQRSVNQELDYTPTELAGMTYQQLADESFDHNPKARHVKTGIEFPEDVTTLEEKCDFVRRLPEKDSGGPQVEETRSPQEVFFSSLVIDDYEECGDHIVGQLAGLVERLRKLRRDKRRVAREFEDEVAQREATVSTRMENLQSELTRLKKSGKEALLAAAPKV